jgi:hypothetical protein
LEWKTFFCSPVCVFYEIEVFAIKFLVPKET